MAAILDQFVMKSWKFSVILPDISLNQSAFSHSQAKKSRLAVVSLLTVFVRIVNILPDSHEMASDFFASDDGVALSNIFAAP